MAAECESSSPSSLLAEFDVTDSCNNAGSIVKATHRYSYHGLRAAAEQGEYVIDPSVASRIALSPFGLRLTNANRSSVG